MRIYFLATFLGLLFVGTQPARAAFVTQVLDDNPTGFWLLNDAGPAAVDSSVNGFDGTYETGVTPQGIEGPIWVPSPGLVANFSGRAGGNITFPTPLNLGANGYTIEAWINPSVEDLSQPSRFVASGGNGLTGYAFGTTSGDELIFTSFSVQDYITTEVRLLPNVWQYVGVVLDASNNADFYLNGSFVQSVASNGIGGTTFPTENFTLGSKTPSVIGEEEFFSGGLAGISVYDRPLTPAQIEAQFAAVIPEPSSYLVVSGLAALGAGCILQQRRRKTRSPISR